MTTDVLMNESAARTIREQLEYDGHTFSVGSFVALADGRVVGVCQSAEEADSILDQTGIAMEDGMIVEVRPDVMDVIR